MTREAHGAQEPGPGLAAKSVAAVAGVGLGAVVGGPAGAFVGAAASPMLEAPLQRAFDEVTGRRRRSASTLLQSAADRAGVEADRLVEEALATPETTQLLADALMAASNTVNESKINGLARALSRGLGHDDARIDEEALVIDALSTVETAHIRVLVQLGPERSRSRATSSNLRGRIAPRRGQTESHIAAELGLSTAGVRAVLAVLERVGMARSDDSGELVRLEKLIYELQQEVNKHTELVLKPPKGSLSAAKKPKSITRPGAPAKTGWSLSAFGQVCLDYLADQEPDDAWADERADAEDRAVPDADTDDF